MTESEHRYKIRIRNAAGTLQAEVTDFLWLAYRRKVGLPGLLRFGLPEDHAAIDLLTDYGQVEVHRRDPEGDLDWYQDFGGVFRLDRDRQKQDVETFTAYVPGYLAMLSWRHVLWTSGYADRSSFAAVAAETVMKTLVTYNATSSATTAAGRESFSGEITNPGSVSVEADGGGGNTVDWRCAYAPLLGTLYRLSQIAGGDYDLVRTGATWEFRWYAGQLGSDLSASVTFSEDYDSLGNIEYEERQSQIVTGVVIGGPDQGAQRQISSTQSSGWTQALHVEAFLNRSDLKTTAAREEAGDLLIYERRAQRRVSGDVQQTQSLRYGRDYDLGDLVTRRVFGVAETVKIDEVGVSVDQNNRETIRPGLILT